MNPEYEQQLKNAEQIVNAYGKLLAQLDAGNYGHPISLLPCARDEIKSAIQLLLWELEGEDKDICNSLAQSYVYLSQFIPDDEAEVIAEGQRFMRSSNFDDGHIEEADEAARIINRIKLDMEEMILDVRKFMRA
ncbi:hypothetical protein [Thiohalophilus sp.]|uniref:hypothetical protein n=1 Tax=Thiohalophilus sp. TaxID=3028392 RepID=UPI0039748893